MLHSVDYDTTGSNKYKEKVLKELEAFKGELITQLSEDTLIHIRSTFLDWLNNKQLLYLLDPKRGKTLFEWKVFLDISSILVKIDSLIEEHDKQFGKPVDRINELLRRRMTDFSEEYNNDKIINECNAEKLPLSWDID